MRALVIIALVACSPPAATSTTTETERLATLGRVWGFLQFHHPELAKLQAGWDYPQAAFDWDEALVDAIPRVRDASTARAALAELVAKPGALVAGEDVPRGPATAWLATDKLLDAELSVKLETIRRAARPSASFQVHAGGAGNAVFPNARPYSDSPYPSVELRLLALFRYWNAINYFFPYRDQIDGGWDHVLEEFIPRFIAAHDAPEYHQVVAELATRICDGHAYTKSAVRDALDPRGAKLVLHEIEGQTVVTKRGDDTPDVHVGDVVTAIDGVPIATARDRLRRYAFGSNPGWRDRVIDVELVRSKAEQLELTLRRGSEQHVVRVPTYANFDKGPKPPAWKRLDDIGYIAMASFAEPDLEPAFKALADTRGIVFDMRAYPEFILFELLPYLHDTPAQFVMFTTFDLQHPGTFIKQPGPPIGGGRANAYRGQIAVLVDDFTMSRAEYVTMALQSVPGAIVVGSQTAGADGNVSALALPGGITMHFSGIGILYPDGRATQRAGIAIDVRVQPTIAGLQAGRDEVLESALALLRR